MKTIEITKSDITTPILASAALTGDFTRRGAIVGDNDVAALEALLDAVATETVPCAFGGVETAMTETGWTFTGLPEGMTSGGLTAYMRAALLNLLAPDRYPPAQVHVTDIPRIRPQW